jgi:uncharacterized damage-inducible protein DinB
MHPRLSELAAYVDAQRGAVLGAAAAVPDDRFTERPAPQRWSAAEVCEHLHLVERGCARLIGKLAAEARASGHRAETDTASVLGALDGSDLLDRSTPREAPERVAPKGTLSREEVLRALEESRAELRRAMEVADGLALGDVRGVHPRLGEIDLYQWILFVGHHEARHAPQMAEIASQLGIARPS